ncbi:1,2-diacylglycerol 3-glucosyltransferase [Enterococcus florum]|uniref:1,2-diacylglycerol 3-glucosyltransferase n=1 Tax=Enterococcus florum TaxID=2480627 RepID=A0A4P5PA27_9ENTE|nr:glycosyltransferase family 4 protein [Enterococcus florum]GCF92342.1 1,2-diacylglycerol 3-glucosyltransferase [Enterococcus florum]
MRIGFFTDTYFPQVSGVATSIKTLKEELEKRGHEVYIFTTTDPEAEDFEKDIVRMPSVPFVSFKDRRIVVRGMWFAYKIAKELQLELIHTHTEFGAGVLGKMVGRRLEIPVIHTYHTMYEDYLHYIANGKVVRPTHVKHFIRFFVNHSTGVVCPSERVVKTMRRYGVEIPMRVIPTGIDISQFNRPDITERMVQDLRSDLGICSNQLMILSLSRLSYEKNIQTIVEQFSEVLQCHPEARLVVVGKGPFREGLEELVEQLELKDVVRFTGEIPHEKVPIYYRAADYFVSASSSETQGLTYAEAIASGVQCVVKGNDYLYALLDDERLGATFESDQEFSKTLLSYIDQDYKMTEELKSRKLDEISAERFGADMEEFYLKMHAYYQDNPVKRPISQRRPVERVRVKIASLKKLEDK